MLLVSFVCQFRGFWSKMFLLGAAWVLLCLGGGLGHQGLSVERGEGRG